MTFLRDEPGLYVEGIMMGDGDGKDLAAFPANVVKASSSSAGLPVRKSSWWTVIC